LSAQDELFAAACQGMARAHVPYSKFPVGAAIRRIRRHFTRREYRERLYPEGWCAETSAIRTW
jgi:cytidine deaminase